LELLNHPEKNRSNLTKRQALSINLRVRGMREIPMSKGVAYRLQLGANQEQNFESKRLYRFNTTTNHETWGEIIRTI